MAFFKRLLNIVRAERLSGDLDREQQFHLDEATDRLIEQGMDPVAARREALRRFGHKQRQKEDTRDADVLVWLDSLLADLRYAARSLRLNPGFTLVAVLSIGLGVGANSAIFGLINSVMLKSLPVPHPEELVMVNRGQDGPSSYTNPLWEQIQRAVPVLDAFAYGNTGFNLTSGGEVQRAEGVFVSGSYFPVLGARPAAGRLLDRNDDRRGCGPVAVLSHGFATDRYGSPEAAVGSTVPLDGHAFEIVGVTEPDFFGVDVGSRVQVYAPICAEALLRGTNTTLDARSTWWLIVMGRLKGGMNIEQLNGAFAAASPGIHEATLPDHWPAEIQRDYLGTVLTASPAPTGRSTTRARYSEALFVLMVVSGVVLLIACTNVAHLLMARAAARQREMAVRLAIGAGRGRLIRQLLTESVLLSLLGAVVGVLFARWAGQVMVGMLSTGSSQVWLDLSPDLRVLAFTIGVATLTGLLFGLAPAWRAARVSPQAAMQAGGRGMAQGRGRFAVTRGLVIGQVALSLVLLVGAGLLLRSFQKLVTLDPGFRREGVLLVEMDFELTGYADERRVLAYREALERLRALPGARSASAVVVTPISGMGWNGDIEAEGFAPKTEREGIVWFNAVSDGYFETMQTRRIAGRDFGPQDVSGGAPVAIINESMARRVFGAGNPIGRTFRPRNGRGLDAPVEVIGLVQDARYRSLRDTNTATAYLPWTQAELWGTTMRYAVRTDGDPAASCPRCASWPGISTAASRWSWPRCRTRYPRRSFASGCWPRCRGSSGRWRCCWRRWDSTARWPTRWRGGTGRSACASRWAPSAGRWCAWCWAR